MVQQMIDGIQFNNNLTITLAKTNVKDDNIWNWLGAVSYMATKVTEAFGLVKDDKNKLYGGNGIRISAVKGHGKGRVGIGKGCGHGRRWDRRLSNVLFLNVWD